MGEDIVSLEGLYRAHAPGLVVFLYARLKDRAWAEDVLHDVFVAFMRQPREEIERPQAYLYRAAHRLSLNALRDRGAARRMQAEVASWHVRPGVDPAQAAALKDALESLADEEREVLMLRAYGQMTFQEIAHVLDSPLTSVYTRHQRAIAAMRRAIEGSPHRGSRP